MLGLPLFAAGLAVLAGSGGGSPVQAATSQNAQDQSIVFSARPLLCPSHGLLGTPNGPEADQAGAVAKAFVSAWWEHRPQAAVAVSDPAFHDAARRLASGPRHPPPGVSVVRITGIGHDPAGPGLALHCGKALLRSVRIATVRVLHGGTITAGIYLVRRPSGYFVWAVR
jgi:hypothetical protein